MLHVIPLGGLGEIGLNAMVVACRGEMLLIDCGLMFPPIGTLGVDIILPDFTYLRQNASLLKGILLTHGHEDHVGALPFLLNEVPVPVYGTRFTLGKTGDLYRERYWQQSQLEAVEQFKKFFAPRKKSLVSAAVAWVLQQPGITSAIIGASKPEQLDDSLAAVDVKFDEEEKEALNLVWFGIPRPAKPVR